MLAVELNSVSARNLLTAVDRMREILQNEAIALPEIVVVGDQSVGKSSVLETVSGIQLPRADYICTRCPLELQIKVARKTDNEYATIWSEGIEKKDLHDLSTIADAVTQMTEKIAGKNTNVSAKPIYLVVYKKNIPYDLTLIDLPGITRNPVGDQDEDIEDRIVDLIKKYIKEPTAIVLHVIPADVDFTTAQTLKIAKEYDPECDRQMIVATKIDKYETGIADKLLGNGKGAMKLKLGCVAVLNRNQDQINKNISFEELRKKEEDFFVANHEAFANVPNECKGGPAFIRRIVRIQQEHIRSTLPSIIEELKNRISRSKKELNGMPVIMSTENECWARFQTMIYELRESIHARVRGDYSQDNGKSCLQMISDINDEEESSNDEINLVEVPRKKRKLTTSYTPQNTRLAFHYFTLQKRFQADLRNSFSDFFNDNYRNQVIAFIKQASGVHLPNFSGYHIIEGLFQTELNRLPTICLALVQNLYEYLQSVLVRLFNDAFDCHFPRLIEKLKDILLERLAESERVCEERVKEILNMERRLFTLNHYYMTTINKCKQRRDVKQSSVIHKSVSGGAQATDVNTECIERAKNQRVINGKTPVDVGLESYSNEAQAASDIQESLFAYCKVVQKRMVDTISQICYYQSIDRCALLIDQDLMKSFTSSELMEAMREPIDQTQRREMLARTIQNYEAALRLGRAQL